MANKPYWQLLKDPRWQKKRLEILERDEWRCKSCYEGLYPNSEENYDLETLHVHHKSYEWGKDPWDYPDWNFVTLCESCHEEEKHVKIHESNLLIALRRNGFLSWHFAKLVEIIEQTEVKCIGPTLHKALESWSTSREEKECLRVLKDTMYEKKMPLAPALSLFFMWISEIITKPKILKEDKDDSLPF